MADASEPDTEQPQPENTGEITPVTAADRAEEWLSDEWDGGDWTTDDDLEPDEPEDEIAPDIEPEF